MKFILPFPLICLVSFACGSPALFAAAEKPQAVLDSITQIRLERAKETREASKRIDTAALQKEIAAKAKSAIEGIDPAKVDLPSASAWQQLFSLAEDYQGAQAGTRRWAAESSGTEKFTAQMALVTVDARLNDYTEVRKTLLAAQPATPLPRITSPCS